MTAAERKRLADLNARLGSANGALAQVKETMERIEANNEQLERLLAMLREPPPPGKTRPQQKERPRLELVSDRKAAA